jgi:hypothetical protein
MPALGPRDGPLGFVSSPARPYLPCQHAPPSLVYPLFQTGPMLITGGAERTRRVRTRPATPLPAGGLPCLSSFAPSKTAWPSSSSATLRYVDKKRREHPRNSGSCSTGPPRTQDPLPAVFVLEPRRDGKYDLPAKSVLSIYISRNGH